MAWDEVSFCGQRGFSGDKPIDEVATALGRIAAQYEDRFARKPFLAEVLYAIDAALASSPERILADHGSLDGLDLERAFTAPTKSEVADPAEYEGAFVDEPEPGHYIVQTKPRPGVPERDVIKVSRLAVEGRALICEYQVLHPSLSAPVVELLIRRVLLEGFCDRYYEPQADTIEFRRLG